MYDQNDNGRIPDDVLTYHWLSFMHKLLEGLQSEFRRQRDEHGLSQDDMARRIGKSPSFVSRCLRGHQNMTVRTMSNIARSMDCRVDVRVQPTSTVLPANQRPEAYWQDANTGTLSGSGSRVSASTSTVLAHQHDQLAHA